MATQHSVFTNPAPRTRAAFPFVVVLQADLSAKGPGRIAAPMLPRSAVRGAVGRLLPLVTLDGQEYLVALELIATASLKSLGKPIGSIAECRDQITRALDWLFTGV